MPMEFGDTDKDKAGDISQHSDNPTTTLPTASVAVVVLRSIVMVTIII